MDPTTKPPRPPVGRPQPPGTAQPPIPRPKVLLQKLDAEFVRDMDNEALDGLVRLWAGRLHQLLLHVQLLRLQVMELAKVRLSDLQQIDENFQGIMGALQQFPGTTEASPGEAPPPEGEGAASAAEEMPPGEPAGGAEPAPPAPPRPAAPRRQRPGGA